MKRIVICSGLLAMAIALSIYSHTKVMRVSDEMNARIDALMEMLPSGDREALARQSASLADYWDEQEEILVHFTRHSYLDAVATGVSRLAVLALYGDFPEFGAELSSIRRHMRYIRGSELLTFDNLM